MNIKSAKQQIKNSVDTYLLKDQFGDYCISIEKQRPILLIGAPGIGKTAIMEQIAGELAINLVAYSMTHHTRQSAIGLPFITEKTYGQRTYSVSEYTMSEIIASVYECMENTGIKEGILFLDEINCISETLAPAMLQFLQYKIFGKHRLPEGWVVISAGNPPEYNNSVREYDVATLDRLKKITVEADYGVWKEYAYEKGIHASILTYLDIKQSDFYLIESSMEGKSFVTARGWEDLSVVIFLYEQGKIEIDEELIGQYLQHKQVAADFAIYYELYMKYKQKYDINRIFDNNYDQSMIAAIKLARFDERLSFIGAAIDAVNFKVRELRSMNQVIDDLYEKVKFIKISNEEGACDMVAVLDRLIEEDNRRLITYEESNTLTKERKQEISIMITILNGYKKVNGNYTEIKEDFEVRVSQMKSLTQLITDRLEKLFIFMEKAFGDSQEMMILMTNLTMNPVFTWFLSKYGCKKYFQHHKKLLFHEREDYILDRIEQMEREKKLQA
jgi:hypothetical protein